MRQSIQVFKAALAVSYVAIAACGGSGSSGNSASPPSSVAPDAAIKAAAAVAAGTPSVSGTTIPAATEITDKVGNVWTVTSGVVNENGALAGASQDVTLLLYDDGVIYQESSPHAWSTWNDTGWVPSRDPRTTPTANGSTIPGVRQITDDGGNVWLIARGRVYENGALATKPNAAGQLAYDNKLVYQQSTAGAWSSWNGHAWVAGDPPNTESPSGTTIPGALQITDGSGNFWSIYRGQVYENDALAGYSNDVVQLTYDNGVVYQQNTAGGWWSWTRSSWASSSAPVSGTPGAAPTISGSPVTTDIVGEAYSFLPASTNPGGGALSFSIVNLPVWGSFSTVTGELTGTPSKTQSGTTANIVISVSSGGESAALKAFSITVSTGSADLSWTAPDVNTNGTALTDLAGYRIYYGVSPDSLTETMQVADPGATSYVVSNLDSGTYYFAVAAYATDGTESTHAPAGSKAIL